MNNENTHYTQLIDFLAQHENEICVSDPVDAMTYILDLMLLVGDNPLITNWLAFQYGLKCKHHLVWYDYPQDIPSDYVSDFMRLVPSEEPKDRALIIADMRRGYALLS